MSTDKITDPFDDNNEFESFEELDENGMSDTIHDDDPDSDGPSSFDDVDSDDGSDVQPAPQKPVKAATAVDQPKAFIKTKLGIACIAGCVAMLGIVGVGASGILSSSATQEVVEQAEVPAPSEPASFGVKAGIADVKPAAPALAQQIQPVSAVHDVQLAQQNAAQSANPILQAIPNRAAQAPVVAAPQIGTSTISSSEVAELRSSIVELQEQTKAIATMVKDVTGLIERTNRRQDDLMNEVKGLKEDIAKAALTPAATASVTQPAEKAEVKAAAVATTPAKPALVTDGRTRLPGLQVIDTSQNGEMSIIKKASNGRIFTLYPDEVINWAGNRQKVSGIEKDGSIVLVGEKFFIDKVLEAPKADPKPARQAPQAQAQTKRDPVATAPVSARGFTLNAVYDSNNTFGVVNDKGEFKSYKKGETIDKLGTIKGLTPGGDLEVGNTVIHSVY